MRGRHPRATLETRLVDNGFSYIIGVDEAGRAPLAGPVVAAAVWLPSPVRFSSLVRDSKKLSESQRLAAFNEIQKLGESAVGVVSQWAIDHDNILQATWTAMNRAVAALLRRLALHRRRRILPRTVCLVVDGPDFRNDLDLPVCSVVGGDDSVRIIACASIVAKVTRDRMMLMYHKILPQYGFDRHKGYPTQAHKQAIQRHGLSWLHRRSFCHDKKNPPD